MIHLLCSALKGDPCLPAPDHVQEVALRIAEIRSTLAEKTVSQSHDPLELLQLIAAAADGDSGKRDLLAKAADAEMAAPFEGERLQSQVHGIARTLSRCTPEDLAQDPTSRKLLIALRDAISSIAPADSTSS